MNRSKILGEITNQQGDASNSNFNSCAASANNPSQASGISGIQKVVKVKDIISESMYYDVQHEDKENKLQAKNVPTTIVRSQYNSKEVSNGAQEADLAKNEAQFQSQGGK